MLTLEEARVLGREKLKIDAKLFERSLQAARSMDAIPRDEGVIALALAIMGVARAHESKHELADEFTSALQLISMAEKEWRMTRDHRFLH